MMEEEEEDDAPPTSSSSPSPSPTSLSPIPPWLQGVPEKWRDAVLEAAKVRHIDKRIVDRDLTAQLHGLTIREMARMGGSLEEGLCEIKTHVGDKEEIHLGRCILQCGDGKEETLRAFIDHAAHMITDHDKHEDEESKASWLRDWMVDLQIQGFIGWDDSCQRTFLQIKPQYGRIFSVAMSSQGFGQKAHLLLGRVSKRRFIILGYYPASDSGFEEYSAALCIIARQYITDLGSFSPDIDSSTCSSAYTASSGDESNQEYAEMDSEAKVAEKYHDGEAMMEQETYDPHAPVDVHKLNDQYLSLHESGAIGLCQWVSKAEDTDSIPIVEETEEEQDTIVAPPGVD